MIYKQKKKSLNVIKCIILHDITPIRACMDFPMVKENALGDYKIKNIYTHDTSTDMHYVTRECAYIFKSM